MGDKEKEKATSPNSCIPLRPRKKLVKEEDNGYQIELRFNEKAELIKVHSTKDMNLEMLNSHIIVGALYLSKLLIKDKEGE
jgi:hypothetical protein